MYSGAFHNIWRKRPLSWSSSDRKTIAEVQSVHEYQCAIYPKPAHYNPSVSPRITRTANLLTDNPSIDLPLVPLWSSVVCKSLGVCTTIGGLANTPNYDEALTKRQQRWRKRCTSPEYGCIYSSPKCSMNRLTARLGWTSSLDLPPQNHLMNKLRVDRICFYLRMPSCFNYRNNCLIPLNTFHEIH